MSLLDQFALDLRIKDAKAPIQDPFGNLMASTTRMTLPLEEICCYRLYISRHENEWALQALVRVSYESSFQT